VNTAEVVEERVSRLQAKPLEVAYIPTNPLHLDTRLFCSLPGLRERLVDPVHPGDPPAARGEVHGVASRPAARVERSAGR
jgi:hypothetical protein